MRVNADGCVDRRMLFGQPETGFQIRRTVARPDGQHVLDAGSGGPLDHCIAVLVEIGAIQMAMRIDHACLGRLTSSELPPEHLRESPPAPACRLRATRPRSCRSIRFRAI